MSEQEKYLLSLVENGYTIEEIKEKSNIKMQELFPSFVVILKYEIEKFIINEDINMDLTRKIILHMDDLADNKEVSRSIGSKKIRSCKEKLQNISKDSAKSRNFSNLLHASLSAIELKIKQDKRKRHYDSSFKEIDKIIFEKHDIEESLSVIKKHDFNINYINNTHLIYFLIEEYTECLKDENNYIKINYYRDLIDHILVIPKFKLKNEDKLSLNYEMTKTIEKIKRNKSCKNKKQMMNHLNTLINKIKNKDLILFTTKTESSFTGNRRNLTNEYTITIDNPDTRVYDDALSIKVLKNGNYLLGIHIADANSMVSQKLLINDQLLENLRDKENVSSNIAMFKNYPVVKDISLKKGQSRPTNSLFVEITKKGEIIEYEFVKGIIKVNDNMSFGDIRKKLKSKDEMSYQTLDDLIAVTSALRERNTTKEIYTGLKILSRDSRMLNEPIFDVTNVQFNYGRMVVQESMILYNQLLAGYFYDNDYPFIYKNREKSDEIFRNSEEVNKVIQRLKDKKYPNDKIIEALLSLYPTTEYSTVNKGNSALQVPYYCSSTCPLRYANDKLAGIALDKGYFKKPKDKDLYAMEDIYKLLAPHMTKSSEKTLSSDAKQIKKYAKTYLNQIRNID